jgi:hypothetical protein
MLSQKTNKRLDQDAELVAIWGGRRAPDLAAHFGIARESGR